MLALARRAHLTCSPALTKKSLNRFVVMMTQEKMDDSLSTVLQRLRALPALNHEPVSQSRAAVLVPLFEAFRGRGTDCNDSFAALTCSIVQDEEGTVRVLLTRRAATLKKHKGEVAFPGGKRDADDTDDVSTALRETHEEIGLPPERVDVIAQLPPVLSKHHLSVCPVIGTIPNEYPFSPNPAEVDAIFSMRLASFLEDSPKHYHQDVPWQSTRFRLHYFEHKDFIVWGLTAGLLIQVAQKCFNRPPAFPECEAGGRPYGDIFYDGRSVKYRER